MNGCVVFVAFLDVVVTLECCILTQKGKYNHCSFHCICGTSVFTLSCAYSVDSLIVNKCIFFILVQNSYNQYNVLVSVLYIFHYFIFSDNNTQTSSSAIADTRWLKKRFFK